MSDSNNDKTNSDNESNSKDDKTNSADDETNIDDSLKPLSFSIDLSAFANLSLPASSALANLSSSASSVLANLSSPASSILALTELSKPDLSAFANLSSPASSVLANLSTDLSKLAIPSMNLPKLLAISIDYSQSVDPPSKQIRIIKNIFESVIDPKKVISEEVKINNLIDSCKERKLVFVLGAGVSKNYGLPDWNTLLQKLLLKIYESKQKTYQNSRFDINTGVLKSLFPQSPIILARNIYLLLNDSDKESFENLIRESMYEHINDTKIDRTFEELQKLCTLCGTDRNIDSIITFNFDDILEKCLTSQVCEPIYKDGVQSRKLPVYHVHGFLPRKENKEKLDDSNKIIFREELYHQLYTDVYCWSNIVQIDKFTNNTCLFIGISLTDPNLRRLLDVANKLRGNELASHYIIKERYNKTRIIAKVSKAGTFEEINELKETIQKYEDEDFLQSLLDFIHDSEEKDALSFGVNIIWVDNYNEEIPKILQKIRSS